LVQGIANLADGMGQSTTTACCVSRDAADSLNPAQRQKEQGSLNLSRLSVDRVYNIEKTVLGTGSVATVKKAWLRRRPHIARAIKQVDKDRVRNKATIGREIGVLVAFDHPNICKLFESYADTQYFYLVMEFIDGQELEHELQENIRLRRHNETRCSVIMQHVFSAVSYCHDSGVLHRDLRPENMMIYNAAPDDLHPLAKLIDFGLALEGPSVTQGCSTGRVEGRVAYLAPEVHCKTIYSEASDMWSLGVIIFIMFLLRFPSNGNLHSQFQEIASVGGRDIVSGLLKRDPRMRLIAAQAWKHPWTQRETLVKNSCSESDREVIA